MLVAGTTGLLSGSIALLSLLLLRPLARHFNLLDIPDQRKAHSGAVPLIGGLSAFIGILAAWSIYMPFAGGYDVFLICSLLLVLLGTVDDARNLPARLRLASQVLLGALLILGSDVYLSNLGNLLGFGVVELYWLGPVVTIAAVIGATNAFNMVDGIDGLAGSMSLVALMSLLMLFATSGGFATESALAAGIAVALIPYLLANLRIPPFRTRIFMGDAGSMFVGFSVIWLLTKGTQADVQALRPVTALWIIAVPLMDMVAIMIRRARKGQSVMMADRDHLHHIFLRAGFTDRQSLVFITLVSLLMASIGILGEVFLVPEWLMFGLFLGLFAMYEKGLRHVWRLLVFVRHRATG